MQRVFLAVLWAMGEALVWALYIPGVNAQVVEVVRCRIDDVEGHVVGGRECDYVGAQVEMVVGCRVRDGEGPGEGGRDGPRVGSQ